VVPAEFATLRSIEWKRNRRLTGRFNHPRTEFLNISAKRLRQALKHRKFAYEQTLNMLIQLSHEWGVNYWEEQVEIVSLGEIEDDTSFRMYTECLDQIERTERMLKVIWREREWKQSPPREEQIDRFEVLDQRSTAIRETAAIIIKNMLSAGDNYRTL